MCVLVVRSWQTHNTLLYYAAVTGKLDMVNLLVDNGADVDAQNHDGMTALMAAALHDKSAVAKVLLDHGASVRAVDTHRRSALMFAGMSGSVDAARTLLAAGAKKHDRDEVGARCCPVDGRGHPLPCG